MDSSGIGWLDTLHAFTMHNLICQGQGQLRSLSPSLLCVNGDKQSSSNTAQSFSISPLYLLCHGFLQEGYRFENYIVRVFFFSIKDKRYLL